MKKHLIAVAMLAQALLGTALAQPVEYSFSAGLLQPFVGTTNAPAGPGVDGAALISLLAGTQVSGTFMYDPTSPFTGTSSSGASVYGVVPSTLQTSFSALSGSVHGGSLGAGLDFSDPRGFSLVWNDSLRFSAPPGTPPPPPVDGFQLQTDNFDTSGVHNLDPFTLGGYTLWNVRMFWFENQATPQLIGDYLDSQSLLAAPPAFHGRLALDFKRTGESGSLTQFHVFYDGLAVAPVVTPVPEPETYALMLAGLGLLGFQSRRRALARRAG